MDQLLAMKYGEVESDELDERQGEVPHRETCSSPIQPLKLNYKSAAPNVNESLFMVSSPRIPYAYVAHNPAEELCAPILGHVQPFARDASMVQGLRNHKLGLVEDAAIASCMFDEQYNTFQGYGYAENPEGSEGSKFVGDVRTTQLNDGASVFNRVLAHEHRKQHIKQNKRGRDEGGDVVKEEDDMDDPTSNEWLQKKSKSLWVGQKEGLQGEFTGEQKGSLEAHAKNEIEKEKEKGERFEIEDKSTFHGKEEIDYDGRSWIVPPKDVKPTNEHCYIPKKWVHTWSGHTKGVSAIRFFPKSGHLLLSAGMDTKVKIWDVHGSGKCMRTYMGHSKAVRDIAFNNDGSRFLTTSYDRKIKLWDTETGHVISSFSTGKIPYVVKFNPSDDKQNVFLAGMSDKKVVQWDINTGEINQEYNQHLGAINTITFVDNNRRFVTSSDDRSLRVWEFGIPVVIKYISEPSMHSMPSIAVHPKTPWFAAQSLDNRILVYSTQERFRLNTKKHFAGHIVAGYACQVNFSPDGRFIMSGDGEGRCWFWDWKTCKVFRTVKCHEGVCMGVEWHPLEQSKVATCGWDGLIKYWD